MPIDFTAKLVNFEGATMTDNSVKDGQPITVDLTLSRLTCAALLGQIPGDPVSDAEEHLKRFLLATYIKDNHAAALSAEELTLIKSRIAKCYNNAMAVGQAALMLDPASAAPFARDPKKKAA